MRFDAYRRNPGDDPPPGLPDLNSSSSRRGFWLGFALSLFVCTLVAAVAFWGSGRLGKVARSAMQATIGTPAPPRIDLAAAQARLHQAAPEAGMVFPFPDPHILLIKEYGELNLSYGERFIKRYRVRPGAGPAEGTYAVTGHALPKGADPLAIVLEGCQPTSASAAIKLHAGRAAAGQGRFKLIGDAAAAPPSAPTPPAAPVGATSATLPAATPAGAGGAAAGGAGAPAAAGVVDLSLPEHELVELFAATAPGSLVVVVEK